MSNYTQTLAGFATQTQYGDLPKDVVHNVKRLILDTLGNAIGGLATTGSRLALKTKQELGGAPESTVIGTGHRTSPTSAAFCNATLGSALEADDTCLNLGHHAQCSLFPALALAERHGASGSALITAVTLGYELGARIASAARHIVVAKDGSLQFNPSGGGVNWVVFPAVIGAGKILGLERAKMESALGIAGFNSTIPTGARWNRPRWNHLKYNPYAFMAESGTFAALLAENGFTGDPDIFDGDIAEVKANWWKMSGCIGAEPDDAVSGLGDRWVTRETSFKPYPSCRFTHGPLGLFEKIIADNGIAADDIEHVDIYSNQMMFAYHMESPVVAGETDCQFSMPHMIAMAALRIPAGPEWVAERYWQDERIAGLKARVVCHKDDAADGLMVQQLIAGRWEKNLHAVSVKAGGKSFDLRAEYSPGDPFSSETEMSDAALQAKFRNFSAQHLSEGQASRVIDIVMSLETQDSLAALLQALS